MRQSDNPFLMKESLSGGPAPVLFQFLPHRTYYFSATQGDQDLLIWERIDLLACAVGGL